MLQLTQRLAKVLPAEAIQIGRVQQHGVYHEQQLELKFQALSPDVLRLIGKAFEYLPVSMSDMHASINNGLIDGKFHLSVWGR